MSMFVIGALEMHYDDDDDDDDVKVNLKKCGLD